MIIHHQESMSQPDSVLKAQVKNLFIDVEVVKEIFKSTLEEGNNSKKISIAFELLTESWNLEQ